MNELNLPNGIQNIALSFSGGGFRAATYTLGCVGYLQSIPFDNQTLLDKVRFISSASGGSITALTLYSLLREGKDFLAIQSHLLKHMAGDKLMKRVFEILATDSYWTHRKDKSRNMINAFAIAYDEDFFSHATYGDLFKSPVGGEIVIEELSVNTTEFNNGQNFRFGTKGIIGNAYLSLARSSSDITEGSSAPENFEIIKKIRLGDIMACSSCFPGGFEPVVFPRDFSWSSCDDQLSWQQLGSVLNYKSHYSNTQIQTGIRPEMASFMDGGIDDNQGIYAFLRANDRTGANYDLYLPCDVSSNYLEKPFSFPKKNDHELLKNTIPAIKRKLKRRMWVGITTLSLLLITGLLMLIFTQSKTWGGLLTGIGSGILLFSFITYMVISSYWAKIQGLFHSEKPATQPGTWKLIWDKYKQNLTTLPLSDLLLFTQSRLSSVFLLVDTIYLKKIRRMSYDNLFKSAVRTADIDEPAEVGTADSSVQDTNQGGLSPQNICATPIYLLSTKNDWMLNRSLKSEPWDFQSKTISIDGKEVLFSNLLVPSDILRTYIDLATAMETTLWFDDYHVSESVQQSLLIAGQATTCFNLLLFVHRTTSSHPHWELLRAQLAKDWISFKRNPEFMLPAG